MDKMGHICPAHMDLFHAAQPRVGKWGTADASTQHYTTHGLSFRKIHHDERDEILLPSGSK